MGRITSIVLASLALALTACPKGAPAPKLAAKKQQSGAHAAGPVSKPGEVGFAPCSDHPCMYHAGAATYHECFAAADGQCFHYGTTCEPKSACMFDKASATYRSCSDGAEGVCNSFGAPCQPEGSCVLHPQEYRYHTCESFKAGKCEKFGALCEPS
jgi:hypothetical protein